MNPEDAKKTYIWKLADFFSQHSTKMSGKELAITLTATTSRLAMALSIWAGEAHTHSLVQLVGGFTNWAYPVRRKKSQKRTSSLTAGMPTSRPRDDILYSPI